MDGSAQRAYARTEALTLMRAPEPRVPDHAPKLVHWVYRMHIIRIRGTYGPVHAPNSRNDNIRASKEHVCDALCTGRGLDKNRA